MSVAVYAVGGMVCRNCAGFVTDAIAQLAGVQAVEVDVERGRVTVTSERPLDDADVRRVIDEAGYTLGPTSGGAA